MTARDGRTTAYVCHDFSCREPSTDLASFARQLEDVAAPKLIR
jgi:uncharacterized protein YyaL (SSP411 family)